MTKRYSFCMVASCLFLMSACHKTSTEDTKNLAPKSAIVNAAALGTVYYVDNVGGNDSNTGKDAAHAWATLAKVNGNTFAPGDNILFINGGMWTGTLSPLGSGTLGKPIIIGSYGISTSKPLINGNGALRTVYLSNQQYWEITNLEVTNTGNAGQAKRGIEVVANDQGKLSHIVISNNYVHDILGETSQTTTSNGIYVNVTKGSTPVNTWFDSVLIANNTLKAVSGTGIETLTAWMPGTSSVPSGAGFVPFTNMVIRNNYLQGIGHNSIHPQGATGCLVEHNLVTESSKNLTTTVPVYAWSCNNTIFQFNEVYNTYQNNGDGEAFDIDYAQDGTIYQYNYSHDNPNGFILVCTSSDYANTNGIIRFNISQNDGTRLFRFAGKTRNTQVYNNTLYLSFNSTIKPISVESWNGYAQSASFTNNLFYLTGAGSWDGIGNVPTFSFENNIVYGVHTPGEPTGTNKITGDPLFVSPGSGTTGSFAGGAITLGNVDGYKLGSGSPAFNAGKLITDNGGRDYYVTAVSSTTAPNIGAYNGAGTALSRATCYQNCSYGGYAVVLNNASYTLAQLQTAGIKNDDVSSLKVEAGYQVVLYSNDNFSGDSLVVDSDKDCLIASSFNDKTSSLKIMQAPTVALYTDCNYAGFTTTLGVGQYDLPALTAMGFQNDNLSSLQIPNGYQVTLYSDAGFTGSSVVITSNTSCLTANNFNDMASSLKIARIQ